MSQIIHYIGLDVHKDSVAVSVAPQHVTEVRRYGIINSSLDAADKLIKKLSQPNVELHFVYEAGPCGFVLCRHLRSNPLDLAGPCRLLCDASSTYPPGRELTGSQPPRLAFNGWHFAKTITLNFRASAPGARPHKTGVSRWKGQPPST